MDELIEIKITPKDVFVPGGLKPVLAAVDAKIKEFHKKHILDMQKKKDRDILRSFSAQIPRSKAFVDDKRKIYVKDKKAELKIIDSECKIFRDEMDLKKAVTRKPLTDWEDAEKARIEEERQFEIYLLEWDEAIAEDDIFNREKALALKEAEIAKVEEEKRQKDEEERLAKAQRDAEAKIQHEKDEKERIKREAQEAAEIAKRDKIAAEERAKLEKEIAIQKAKDEAKAEAQKKEQQRLDREKAEKEAAEKKAANKRHQANINNKILAAFNTLEIPKDTAKKIVIAVCQGKIPHMTINY